MFKLNELKDKWLVENGLHGRAVDSEYLELFQNENNVVLPNDLIEYHKSLNGTGGEYTDDLFEFYGLDRIKKIKDEFKNWTGIPNYNSLLEIGDVNQLYVFANFSFHLFVYAIKLNSESSNENEVYVLCGSEFKKISYSFSEFIELYLNDDKELYFNKGNSDPF